MTDHQTVAIDIVRRARATPDHPGILLKREVLAIVRLHHDALARLEARNMFPRRIKLGLQKVGWLETEVSAWLADRMAERFEARPVD